MTNGISLEQARAQLNLPYNATEAEVRAAARENNIVIIDFSGSTQQSAGLNTGEDLGNALNGSSHTGTGVYDDAVSFGNSSQTNQNQETLEQKLAKFYGRVYTDADSAKKQELVKQYIKNILNNKSDTKGLEDLKLLVANTPADSEIAQALAEAVEASGNEELKAAMPENFVKNVKAAAATESVEEVEEVKTDEEEIPDEDDPVWQKNKKNGPGLDETLTKFYGKKYTNASEEEKEKLIVKYFDWLSSTKKGKISQSKQWELYKERCTSPEEYRRLCSVIDKMEADQQASAIESAVYKGTKVQRKIGRGAVLQDLVNSKYAESAIPQIKEILSGREFSDLSPDEKIEFNDQLVNAYNKYQAEHPDEKVPSFMEYIRSKQGFNISGDENVDEKIRIEKGLDAADHVGSADAEDQNKLVEDGYKTGLVQVQTRMAENTINFAAEAQRKSVELGTQLGNEDINNIFANDAYNYDITNRDDIIRMIKEQGSEKTLEILENARKTYEEQSAQLKADSDAKKAELERQKQAAQNTNDASDASVNNKKTQSTTSLQNVRVKAKSEGLARAVSSDEFREFKTKEKTEFVNTLSKADRKEAIQSIVENAHGFELDALMFSGLKNDILNYLVSHPTSQNKEKLKYLQRYLSASDVNMVQQMQQERMTISEKVEAKKEALTENNNNGNNTQNPFKFGFLRRN